jgi:hypothetical protein
MVSHYSSLQLSAALLPLADIHVFDGRILDGINVLVCQESLIFCVGKV